MIFWKILLAHVFTDFIFQPDPLVENKRKIAVLFVHSLIFFSLSIVILLPTFSYQTVIALVFLALFHGSVDYFKNLIQKRIGKKHWGLLSGRSGNSYVGNRSGRLFSG